MLARERAIAQVLLSDGGVAPPAAAPDAGGRPLDVSDSDAANRHTLDRLLSLAPAPVDEPHVAVGPPVSS